MSERCGARQCAFVSASACLYETTHAEPVNLADGVHDHFVAAGHAHRHLGVRLVPHGKGKHGSPVGSTTGAVPIRGIWLQRRRPCRRDRHRCRCRWHLLVTGS
jgi:hypothetical protein